MSRGRKLPLPFPPKSVDQMRHGVNELEGTLGNSARWEVDSANNKAERLKETKRLVSQPVERGTKARLQGLWD